MSGMGRDWTSVTLKAADCDIAKISETFSNNYTSTPTQVYRGAISWPTITGRPAKSPASWGGQKGEYRFPFATPWIYVGVRDICLDYDFSGGTLANQAPWASSKMVSYYLDGYSNITHAQAKQTSHGRGSAQGGCIDSATTGAFGAYGYLDARSYGPTYQIPHFRNQHEIYSRSYRTAPGKPVVHVVGLGGTSLGTGFPGINCNRLHLDLSKPAVYFFRTADQTSSAYTYNSIGMFPYTEAAEGLPLWWQAAWDDSSTGQLHLTRAVETFIPAVPKLVQRKVLFQTDPAKKNSTGFGPYDYSSHNPVVRYGQ